MIEQCSKSMDIDVQDRVSKGRDLSTRLITKLNNVHLFNFDAFFGIVLLI
jgi:hypothetical protein